MRLPSNATAIARTAPAGAASRRTRRGGVAGGVPAAAPRTLGRAVAPGGTTVALPRGTHRTRVSEARLSGAPTAARRPAPTGAGAARTGRAIARDGEDAVRPGTG